MNKLLYFNIYTLMYGMLIIVMVGLLRDVLTPCTSPVEVGGKSTNLDTYSYVEIGGPEDIDVRV